MKRGSDDEIRVLHVDDDPEFSDLTATFLERKDERFAVETAVDADDGVARLAEHDFDCVVSDYDMPGESGIEFLRSVRRNHPDVPFILFTGKGSEEVASEAISAGVTDYLQKGTETSQYVVLANRIANNVDRYRARLERQNRRKRRDRQSEAILDLTTDDAVVGGDFEAALARITETAADVLGVDRVNVWLFDDERTTLRCVDHFERPAGTHERGMTLLADAYPTYFDALTSSRSVAVTNAAQDPRTSELESYLEEHGVGALLDATVRSGGQVVGMICHEHVGRARTWTDDEQEFASDVAEIVHRALRNRDGSNRRRDHE